MSPLVITVVLTVTAVLACCWLGQVCHTQASDWNVSATYVVVMGWLYFMPAAFASFTGNKVVSRDIDGNLILLLLPYATAVARVANVLLLLVPVVFFIRALRGRPQVNPTAVLAALLCVISATAAGLDGYPVYSRGALTLFLALLPVTILPSGRGVCLGGTVVVVTLAAASGLLTLVNYDLAISPCVGDYKCGPLGVFVFGIVDNENGLALALATGSALLWLGIRGRKQRVALYGYLTGMVVISGARTSAVALAAALLVLVMFDRAAQTRMQRLELGPPDRGHHQGGSPATATAGVVVVVLAAVATVLPYVTNDPLAYTRRGALWLVARQRLAGHQLEGLGSPAWSSLADRGLISVSSSYSVHNQFLDVRWISGTIGVVLFVAVLILILKRDLVLGAVLLAPVLLLGITERPWSTAHVDSTTFAYLASLIAIPVVTAVRSGAAHGAPAGDVTAQPRAGRAVSQRGLVGAAPMRRSRTEAISGGTGPR